MGHLTEAEHLQVVEALSFTYTCPIHGTRDNLGVYLEWRGGVLGLKCSACSKAARVEMATVISRWPSVLDNFDDDLPFLQRVTGQRSP